MDASALVATSQGLWIGSDTDRIGRYEYHGRIAFMPLAGGTPVPESRFGTLPRDLFRVGTDGTMTRRAFDGTTLGGRTTVTTGVDWSTFRGALVVTGTTEGRNWSSVSGMTMASGRLDYGTTTGTLSAVDFTAGVPTGPTSVVRTGFSAPPEACCSSTSPPDPSRHRPAPPRCGRTHSGILRLTGPCSSRDRAAVS